MLRLVMLILCTLVLGRSPAHAADKVAFGLDWKAEAEYGGYYQAVATGIYAKHGLDVTIRQGGPQANQTQLLLAGRLDFTITSNSFLALNFVQEKLPFVAVAAIFQKDPSILLAHPGQGNDGFGDLRGKPIMIGADTRAGWWNFLRAKFGYDDGQIRPYTFNLAPFLADKRAIQQGYLGSEPYEIEQTAHFAPVVMLLADAGFTGYGSLIATSNKLIAEKPDVVQRFLDATIEGWYSYLYTDPAPGNALIKADNPKMGDDQIAYAVEALKTIKAVDGGDAAKQGIGIMTETRWKQTYDFLVAGGLLKPEVDWKAAFTDKFVKDLKIAK